MTNLPREGSNEDRYFLDLYCWFQAQFNGNAPGCHHLEYLPTYRGKSRGVETLSEAEASSAQNSPSACQTEMTEYLVQDS
jgi:hypothetical protein